MKKIKIYSLSLVVSLMAIFTSCEKGFEDTNKDPNRSANAFPEQLLAPALYNTVRANMNRARTFNNELMQVTVNMSDGEGRVFRYDIRPSWANYNWDQWYAQLMNFRDLYRLADDELTKNDSYKGIALICEAWVFSLLTDTYGDIPYFEALRLRDEGIAYPRFDEQRVIYEDLFQKLEEANELLKGGTAISVVSDPVYNGNVARWRKFGNTWYLRMLMRISGQQEVQQDVVAKIAEIVGTPSTYPIMANNDESAVLRWTGVEPYVSPYLNDVREQDWRGIAIAEYFLSNLSTWADPRLYSGRWEIATYQGGYVGVPSGYVPGTGGERLSYFRSGAQTEKSLVNEPLMGNILNYPELQFLLAEAALNGWITNATPETYYKRAVEAAIKFWIPDWATPVDDYLAAGDITWEESESYSDKMEKIHIQKYYALFFTDFQQWFEYRRTGHPVLPKGSGLRNNGIMPSRLMYPVYVQVTNNENYKAAVARQGKDDINTKVWWQRD